MVLAGNEMSHVNTLATLLETLTVTTTFHIGYIAVWVSTSSAKQILSSI